MANENGPAFLSTARQVQLGTQIFEVRECPLPRLQRFKQVWGSFFESIARIQAEAADDAENGDTDLSRWNGLLDMVFEKPYEILSIVIPDLTKEPFEDEEEGVTIPQIFDAFDVVLEVNRVGWLKKLTPFFQNMILSTDLTQLQSDLVRTES